MLTLDPLFAGSIFTNRPFPWSLRVFLVCIEGKKVKCERKNKSRLHSLSRLSSLTRSKLQFRIFILERDREYRLLHVWPLLTLKSHSYYEEIRYFHFTLSNTNAIPCPYVMEIASEVGKSNINEHLLETNCDGSKWLEMICLFDRRVIEIFLIEKTVVRNAKSKFFSSIQSSRFILVY